MPRDSIIAVITAAIRALVVAQRRLDRAMEIGQWAEVARAKAELAGLTAQLERELTVNDPE